MDWQKISNFAFQNKTPRHGSSPAGHISTTMSRDTKGIAILGSTGSIGTQTLDIISRYPERFRAEILTARRNSGLLCAQARKHRPRRVVMSDGEAYRRVRDELFGTGIEVCGGDNAIAEAAADEHVDTVVTALVGYSGLIPTLAAVDAGKTIALANKETLVAGGEIVYSRLAETGAKILPVDSEHSAIFQCLNGESTREAARIILTASGGPFRTYSAEELRHVTVEQALRNPNWDMGAKVTIDSASMMNKGFEMIEAHWLFGCPSSCIDIVVHPQSVIHSMVEFCDGSVMAQMAVPDMHLPIQYALGWPERLPAYTSSRLSLSKYGTLTFEEPDLNRFPLLGYAFEAIRAGGNMPCILNAANEVAVQAFLERKIPFTAMPDLVRSVMDTVPHLPEITLESLIQSNAEAREEALRTLDALCNNTSFNL